MILAARTFRTGVQTLWTQDGKLFISIRNRSYRSTVELPMENKARWLAYFAQ